MSTKDNAFPVAVNTGAEVIIQPGMTLRDYLAGQALVGVLAANRDGAYGWAAEEAYKYADAMLRVRAKG